MSHYIYTSSASPKLPISISSPDQLLQTMTQLLQQPCTLPRIRKTDNLARLNQALPLAPHLHDLPMQHHPLDFSADGFDLLDLGRLLDVSVCDC